MLLKDDQIVPRFSQIVAGAPLPPGGNWYHESSPIQPASVDLSIGKIFLPGKKSKETGGEQCPIDEHVLRTGGTAVVTTLEEIGLPPDLAGIGFPPSSVSFRGLLMTNPGHVDPGYRGPLRFTVINMGKEPYTLKKGDRIVTILLFQLSGPAHKDWAERRSSRQASPIAQRDLERLSSDFLDVEARAEVKAKAEVQKVGLKAQFLQVVVPILTAVIGIVGTVLVTNFFTPAWKEPVEQLRVDVARLERSVDLGTLKQDVEDLKRQLGGLSKRGTRGSR